MKISMKAAWILVSPCCCRWRRRAARSCVGTLPELLKRRRRSWIPLSSLAWTQTSTGGRIPDTTAFGFAVFWIGIHREDTQSEEGSPKASIFPHMKLSCRMARTWQSQPRLRSEFHP